MLEEVTHLTQEIFGPIITCYVYPDKDADSVLDLVSCLVSHCNPAINLSLRDT